jgi:toxin-antitoxin system PIN domain toxin
MLLLDINILIAIADADHVHHQRARAFFDANHATGWATCPLTENGFIRILGHHAYPKGPGSSHLARCLLDMMCTQPGHAFWPDEISLRGMGNLPVSKHLTDHYLLGLAIHRKGQLATMDKRIDASTLPGGSAAYLVI